jgi:hypothetical protein
LPGALASSLPERRAGALGQDGLQVVAIGGCLQERLAADGQPEPADATGHDVGPALQEVDRREKV